MDDDALRRLADLSLADPELPSRHIALARGVLRLLEERDIDAQWMGLDIDGLRALVAERDELTRWKAAAVGLLRECARGVNGIIFAAVEDEIERRLAEKDPK